MFYTFGNMTENPFPIAAYAGPEYFCNRQKETAQLKEALLNGRNLTLFSPRRMGKTGLIHHLFHGLKKESCHTIYTDIFGTEDLSGFINRLANATLAAVTAKKGNLLSRAVELFGRIRPQLSYDGLSGTPQVSFTLQNDAEKQATLGEIFEILEKQKVRNFVAIDEFQQITRYPEKNIEEILRSHVQHLNNTHFIFSGSQRHLLSPMFTDPRRAFYQSSSFLGLDKLDHGEYRSFIHDHFERGGQGVEVKIIDFILEWTKRYTFYTQYLCNRIFSKRKPGITEELVRECIREIFTERETVFYNFRNLLTTHQFRLLSAVALEDELSEPTGQTFLRKYDLGNASTVRKSLQALVDKEMIFVTQGRDKPVYQVYDVFLSRWFRWRENLD